MNIFFLHGNGFPALCYKQFLDALHMPYVYVDKVGHHPDYPVTDNWDYLVDEIIHNLEQKATMPVHVVGHSMGGVLAVMAAQRRPELFKALILLDSPLLGLLHSWIIFLSKRSGLIDHITPAAQIKKRCVHWQSRAHVMAYLKRKPLFKHFTQACLEDYIDYGLLHDDTGYHLRFNRDIESDIYRTMPHGLPRHNRTMTVPIYLIYGTKSHIIDRWVLSYMRRRYHVCATSIQGGHMFPMEYPLEAAEQVRHIIQEKTVC